MAQQGHKDRPRSQSADFTGRPRPRHSNRGDMSIEKPGLWVPIGPRNHPDSAGWVLWGGAGWCIRCSCAFRVVFLAFWALAQGGQGCSSHAPALLGCATHTDWPHGKAPSAWHSAGSGAEVPNRGHKTCDLPHPAVVCLCGCIWASLATFYPNPGFLGNLLALFLREIAPGGVLGESDFTRPLP